VTATLNTSSVDKAFGLLEFLAASGRPASLQEVTDAVKLPKPTAYRLLQSLQKLGYVSRPSDSHNYLVGPRTARLAVSDPFSAVKVAARPLLRRLHEEYNETINLGALSGNQIIYLDFLETTQALRFIVTPGQSDPRYCTALGRAVASQQRQSAGTLNRRNPFSESDTQHRQESPGPPMQHPRRPQAGLRRGDRRVRRGRLLSGRQSCADRIPKCRPQPRGADATPQRSPQNRPHPFPQSSRNLLNHPMLEYPRSPNTPVSHLPLSPAVKCGALIFVSGQASVDDTGKIISGTFEQEFRRSLDNLTRILHDAGSDLEHVVQTRNYVRDPANTPIFQDIYHEYFKPPYPARTTITNCLPPSLHFEIECIATTKESA